MRYFENYQIYYINPILIKKTKIPQTLGNVCLNADEKKEHLSK